MGKTLVIEDECAIFYRNMRLHLAAGPVWCAGDRAVVDGEHALPDCAMRTWVAIAHPVRFVR